MGDGNGRDAPERPASDGGSGETPSVAGQRAIEDALRRRPESGAERAGGLVRDEEDGATIIDGGRSLIDAARGVVGAAAREVGAVVSAARGLVDAARSALDNENVTLTFECAALDGTWAVDSAELAEELNAPYALTVRLTSRRVDAIEADELLGESCRLIVERGPALRHVTGIVAEVRQTRGADTEYQAFELVVVPAYALLRQRRDSRIFQNLTGPEILAMVLGPALAPYERVFELRLTRPYARSEYRTQYDEADFDFCQRLMEEEGIYAWFEQNEERGETLVLADNPLHFGEIESTRGAGLRFTTYEGEEGGHEAVTRFRSVAALRPTVVRLRSYDWTHPAVPIVGDSSLASVLIELPEHHGARKGPTRERYDHDSEPVTRFAYAAGAYAANDVAAQVGIRRAQQLFDALVHEGEATVVELRAGATFAFENPPTGGAEQRYLVLSARHAYTGQRVDTQFTCIPAATPFRPRRTTPKPRVASLQSAVVTGPAGEEIHTDEHGRIKVQFHWDRLGPRTELSSCWLRVMQPWAGAGWGFVFLPRIGMEVVVSFLDGDPDHPVVVGTLYNGDNPPPYPLPAEKTKSVIKTQSTIGGQGYNELTFDDKAGEELILTHAQKDYREVVEHDHDTTVHNDQRNTVDHDHTNTIGNEHTETVGANQHLRVDGDRDVRVEGTQRFEVMGGESVKYVDGNYLVETTQEITVTAPDKITIRCEGSVITLEPNKITLSAGGGASLTLDENAVLRSSQGSTTTLDDAAQVRASGNGVMRLTADVNLQSDAGAHLELTADGTLTSSGGGHVEVTGPLVKLNC
jgi:type VI secretion system secreted protein VgrG